MKNLVIGVLVSLISITTACSQNHHNHGDNSNHTSQDVDLGKVDKALKSQLNVVLTAYYPLKDALVATNAQNAQTKASNLMKALAKVETTKMTEAQQKLFAQHAEKLKTDAQNISRSEDVEQQRKYFEGVSNHLHALVVAFKANSATAYLQYCPMAFDDKGAYWLSDKKEIRNPYFGNVMLKCGSVKAEF